jgi:putative membrane protein
VTEPPPAPADLLPGRLHPLAILVFARKRIGQSILPIAVVALTWRGGLAVPVLLVAAIAALALLVAEWRRFTYRIENGRLVVERGVFRHTTRVVPLDRIRGVDLQAPSLHRALGLVQVEVEAAAGGTSAAELTLAAVTAAEGERLRHILLSQRRKAPKADLDAAPARVLYHATPRLLVAGGLTSGRHILAPLAVLGVIVNFADDLPGALGERVLDSAADRAPIDALGIGVLVAAVVLLALVLAAAGSLIADWNFELQDEDDRLVAQRGLLTRRAVAIDRARIRGLDLLDSPLRRPFGLVGVRAIAGGIQGGRPGRAALAPVIATADAHALVRILDPFVDPGTALQPHPRAARTRRFARALSVPAALVAVAAALGWWWTVAALVALVAAAVPLAEDRYRQLGHLFDGRRLTVRSGSLQRRRASLDSAAVVSYLVRQSPLQARAGLCSIVLRLGQGAGSRRVLDCSEEQASALLAALDVPLFAPFVPCVNPSDATA